MEIFREPCHFVAKIVRYIGRHFKPGIRVAENSALVRGIQFQHFRGWAVLSDQVDYRPL